MTASQIVDSSPYYDARIYARLGVSPESAFPIVRCTSCDLVYTGSLPSNEDLEQIYNLSDDKDIYDAVAVFSRPGRLSQQLNVFSNLLKILEQKVPLNKCNVPLKKIRILDYGCSFGAGMLSLCRPAFPYRITGIEVNASARAYLRQQSVDVYESLSELSSGQCFDGILLNDVLEHVIDPLGLLYELSMHADENTVLYINVPDFSEWRLRYVLDQIRSKKNVEKDMNPWEHLTYFSPVTLTRMAADAGWKRIQPSMCSYSFIKPEGTIEKIRESVRIMRDWYRFQRGIWPTHYSTSGFFVRDN